VPAAQELAEERSVKERARGPVSEGGLPDLLEVLRWRWKSILLVALVFIAGATVYVESLPSEYEGRALVAVGPRPNVASAGADTVRVVAPKYVAYATARSTIERVAPTIGEDPAELADAIDANVATDTGNVTITARLRTPERAARAANAFARDVVRFSREDPLLKGQVVATALPDDDPAAPPRRLLEAAGALAGILLALGLGLVLERGRPRLRSWREMAKLTGYPVVGRIPPSRTLRKKPMLAFSDPEAASAFRILRANVEPQLREAAVDFIVVTSPAPGDGKTTVAALLAESLGRIDLKVLLVDADLRRPGLARFANVKADPGLSTILRNGGSLNGAVRSGWSENLWLLPTTHDSEAGDLLARHFSDVLDEAYANFDVVVVDTPPLLGTDDARILATMAKGILLVVSANTNATTLNDAILAIEALKAPLLGIVGNRFRESWAAYQY
jgi:capsular exopolysaccharide synthesis family protein